jgi:hypothetical protein
MSEKPKVKKISEKHEEFLQTYVKSFNIQRAYKETYPNSSDAAAASSGSMLLKKPKVAERLKEILRERAERVKVDSTYVVEYLKGAVDIDLQDFAKIGKKGVELKEFKKIPKDIRKYCTEVTMSETKLGTVIVNFKVFSKEKALDMLAKHTGAVKERVEHSGEITVNSITDLVNSHS